MVPPVQVHKIEPGKYTKYCNQLLDSIMCRFWSCTFCRFGSWVSSVCFFLVMFLFGIFFDIFLTWSDFHIFRLLLWGTHGSPSRPRWRLALGGAQLDPATPVAQLTVEDLVKLCNALGQLQPAGEKRGVDGVTLTSCRWPYLVISKSKMKYDSYGVWKFIVCYK